MMMLVSRCEMENSIGKEFFILILAQNALVMLLRHAWLPHNKDGGRRVDT